MAARRYGIQFLSFSILFPALFLAELLPFS